MKNMGKRLGIIILSVVIIAVGVVFIFRGRIIKHFIPVIHIIGDIQIKVKNDTSLISAKMTVKNQTFLKIGIDTIKYKVSLIDRTYLQNQKFIGAVLFGYGEDTIDFSLKIPYIAILNDLKAERKKNDSVNYSINVFLQYSTFFGKGEFPINKSAKVKMPQPPELEVVEIKYKKIFLKSIRSEAKIKIVNNSAFSLSIKKLSYSMDIEKQGNLTGTFEEKITIKPNGTTYINLPIEINIHKIGKTIFQIIINKDTYNYTLTMNAILESSDISKENFNLGFIKIGKMELRK
jgi:LEA14-like dessication related protein